MKKKNTTTYLGLAIGFSTELIFLAWGGYSIGALLVEGRGWKAQSPAYLALAGLILGLVHMLVILKRMSDGDDV